MLVWQGTGHCSVTLVFHCHERPRVMFDGCWSCWCNASDSCHSEDHRGWCLLSWYNIHAHNLLHILGFCYGTHLQLGSPVCRLYAVLCFLSFSECDVHVALIRRWWPSFSVCCTLSHVSICYLNLSAFSWTLLSSWKVVEVARGKQCYPFIVFILFKKLCTNTKKHSTCRLRVACQPCK